jgi:hypothetical protein
MLSFEALGAEFFLGPCRREDDSSIRWYSCARPRAGVETMVGKEMASTSYGEIYLASYWMPWLSMHAQWSLFEFQGKEVVPTHVHRDADFYFVQFGNIAHHSLRARVGKMDLPFGVRSKSWMNFMNEFFLDDDFFVPAKIGAQVDFDTFLSSQYQLGVAQADRVDVSKGHVVAARAMFDLTAVEDFRSVFSYAHVPNEGTKVGFGMVSTTRSQDFTSMEWVKIYPFNKDTQPRQLFYLNYDSKTRSKQSWHLSFVSDQDHHRMGVLGSSLALGKAGECKIGLGYFSSWNDRSRRFWFLTQGLEVKF